MALSKIWSAFIIVALLVAGVQMMSTSNHATILSSMVTGKSGDTLLIESVSLAGKDSMAMAIVQKQAQVHQHEIVKKQNQWMVYDIQSADGIIETCQTAVNMCLKLIGFLALFMGFMSIAEKAGGIRFLSRIIGPFFSKIFPEVPKGHPAMGHMMMNFSANLLGLDNAATPFGLKAMESLQEINPNKSVASNSQIMFLCLHASGLTLIPVSIIALRAAAKSANPMDIFIPCMIATFVATMAAMVIVSIRQRISLLQPVIIAWVLGLSALIALIVVYIKSFDLAGVQSFSTALSSGLIVSIFLIIVLGGLFKKIDVFDAFVEGAKGGFETAVRIIPYLVGMLVAISLLRTSGSFDLLIDGMKSLFAWMGTDTRFVDGLPTALIKPFSGGGARGMMVDTMKTYGPDSFAGRLSFI
jgi:hypothetical protein